MWNNSLAISIRPKTLNDIIGQSHLLDDLGLLTRMVQKNKIYSLIFYGPPGIGKTSLATALANDLNVGYSFFNASIDNKNRLMEIIEIAKLSQQYIIIIEEIHRMNTDRQDILLSILESDNIHIFATTTENPFFVINPALRSRCTIVQLEPITTKEMVSGLKRIISKHDINIELDDACINTIAACANGDVRGALNIIDILQNIYNDIKITPDIINRVCIQSYFVAGDDSDEFHNLKSAFHKSVRGSDVDASLYYLARLIKIGDLKTITRRMICFAYEDIGLANSALCMKVVLGCQAAEKIGFPECHKILSNLVIEMCLSPKSSSAYDAINEAVDFVENGGIYSIPLYIRDSHYKSAKKLGVEGYDNPHNYELHYNDQQYMPDEIIDVKFYNPDYKNAHELKMNNYISTIKNSKIKRKNK